MKKFVLLLLVLVLISGCVSDEVLYQRRQVLVADVVRSHPEWDKRIRDAVLEGSIVTGMTVEQVEWVWSKGHGYMARPPNDWSVWEKNSYYFRLHSVSPNRETRSVSWRMHGESGRLHLYFYDGKLESWSWYPNRY